MEFYLLTTQEIFLKLPNKNNLPQLEEDRLINEPELEEKILAKEAELKAQGAPDSVQKPEGEQ